MKKLIFLLVFIYANAQVDANFCTKKADYIFACQNAGDKTTNQVLVTCNDNKTAQVFPSFSPRANTVYKCNLENKSIEFKTQKLELTSYKLQAKNIVVLQFNYALDLKALKENLQVFKQLNLNKSPINFDAEGSDKTFVLRLHTNSNEALSLEFSKNFLKNTSIYKLDKQNISLDPKLADMQIYDAPLGMAFDDGSLGIRLYLNGYFYDSPIKPFVSIQGVSDFTVSDTKYLYQQSRKNLHPQTLSFVDIKAKLSPNKTYKITLLKGLKDYDKELKQNKTYEIKTPDKQAALDFIFDETKPYLSTLSNIGLNSVNVGAVDFKLYKISSDNYRYFVNLANARVSQAQNLDKLVLEKSFKLNTPKNQETKSVVDIKTAKFTPGVYRLVAFYKNGSKTKYAQRTFFYSNLNIFAKHYKDGIFVGTTRLDNNKPLYNAQVILYDEKNNPLKTSHTNEEGIANIALKEGEKPKSVVVSIGKDKNFLVLNTAKNAFSFQTQDALKALIYMPSKLIRPGDNLDIFIGLKDKNFKSLSLPLRLVVKDPNALKFYETPLDMQALAQKITIPTSLYDKTGKYSLEVFFKDNLIGSKDFFVEEFSPPRISNKITLKSQEFFKNEPIKIDLRSQYLFGAKAQNLKSKLRITALNGSYEDANYKDYSFSSSEKELAIIDKTFEFILDENGEQQIIYSPQNLHTNSILKAQLDFSVFDNAKFVSSYKNFTLYPFDFLVGIKAASNNQTLTISTIALDPKSKKPKQTKLDIFVKRIKWNHYLNERGYYKWEKTYEDVENFSLNSGKTAQKTYPTGEYLIEALDLKGGHKASKTVYISGFGDYENISPTTNLENTEVFFEDKTYKKNDVIKARFKSLVPSGKALVALESDKVLWHKWVDFSNGGFSLDIKLNVDTKSPIYLTSLVLGKDKNKLLRTTSFTPIKIDKSANLSSLSISAPQKIGSQKLVKVGVKTSPNAVVAIGVVDSGVLDLSAQKPLDVLKEFSISQDLGVGFYDFYDKLSAFINSKASLSFGSDAVRLALERMQKHIQTPKLNKDEKPFIVSSKIIKTSSDGKASFSFKTPVTNTKLNITALVIEDKKANAKQVDLLVVDDVSLDIYLPKFFIYNDDIKAKINLANNTNKSLNFTLNIATKSVVTDFKPTKISLKPRETKNINLLLSALAYGDAELKISLKGDANAQKIYKRQVLPSKSPSVISVFRQLKTPMQFNLPMGLLNSDVDIKISNDLSSQILLHAQSLIDYPHSCLEQLSSKVIGLNPAFLQDKSLQTRAKNARQLAQQKILSLQTSMGDFKMYPNDYLINRFATLWAIDALFDDYKSIPKTNAIRIISFLQSLVRAQDTHHIYAAFLLSKINKLNRSDINAIYENSQKTHLKLLDLYMLAAALKNTHQTNEMQKILQKIQSQDLSLISKERKLDGSFYSSLQEIAFSLYIHATYFKRNFISEELAASLVLNLNNAYSTHEKALILRAFNAYYGSLKEGKPSFSLELNSKKINYNKALSLQKRLTSTKLVIEPKSPLFFSMNIYPKQNLSVQEIEDLSLVKPLDSSRVFDLKQSFVNEKGVEINSFLLGSTIFAKLEFMSPFDIKDVVISHKIPSCFEAINENISKYARPQAVKNSVNFAPRHVETRQEGVYFFVDLKANQRYTYFVPININFGSSCVMPDVCIEAMYDSRLKKCKNYKEKIIKINEKEVKKSIW